MKFIWSILIVLFISCSTGKGTYVNKKDINLQNLVGTWQRKGQQKFEKWALVSPTECLGVSYDMSTGSAQIDENIRLYKADKIWIYEVKNKEHEFKPVQFTWKPDPNFRMRFVNEANDYPQVIRYKINNDSTMMADISNLNGEKLMTFDFVKVIKK